MSEKHALPEVNIGDPENPEWTEEDFARARPAGEVLPPEAVQLLVKRRGRPPKAATERKEAISLRLSPDVLAHFRAGGEGWQTRIDEALRAHVTEKEKLSGRREKLHDAIFGKDEAASPPERSRSKGFSRDERTGEPLPKHRRRRASRSGA